MAGPNRKTEHADCDTLLVIVSGVDNAKAIESALLLRGIPARIQPGGSRIIEFGSQLVGPLFEIFVRREDLERASEVLVAKGLPGKDAAPDIRSAFGT